MEKHTMLAGRPILVVSLVLCLLASGQIISAATLEDLQYDPLGDVIDDATNGTVDRPGIDMLNVRVGDLIGDLEVSITLAGAPETNASYTVNVLVDSVDLFTFSYISGSDFYALDPLGDPLTVLGWFDPDRAVWEVSTALLSVDTGLEVQSAYTYVTNATGALLLDSFETVTPTNDPPVVSITAPSEGDNVTGIVTVRGTATDDSGVTAVFLRVDGGDWAPVTGTDSWSHGLDTSGLSDGPHTIEARAFDGNLSSTVVTVTVNWALGGFEPPMVLISWPDGHTVSGTITVTGTAADDGGLDRVEVRLDGGAWQTATGTQAWTLELDTTGLSDGEHRLDAVAYDIGGGASAWIARTFVIGGDPPPNQPPSVTITRPVDYDYITRTVLDFTFEGTATDDVAVKYVEARIGDEEWSVCVLEGDDWSLDRDLRMLEPGLDFVFQARAYDGELYSAVVTINFTMDVNRIPEVRITSTKETSSHLVVTGTAYDDVDPIVSITASLNGEGSAIVDFETVNGDPRSVTWRYNQVLRGLSTDEPHELLFIAFDGFDYSDNDELSFMRNDTASGVEPKSVPGPAVVTALVTFAIAVAVLQRRRRGR